MICEQTVSLPQCFALHRVQRLVIKTIPIMVKKLAGSNVISEVVFKNTHAILHNRVRFTMIIGSEPYIIVKLCILVSISKSL